MGIHHNKDLESFMACDNCKSINQVMCMDCLTDLVACKCLDDNNKPEMVMNLWCDSCQTMYERDLDDADIPAESEYDFHEVDINGYDFDFNSSYDDIWDLNPPGADTSEGYKENYVHQSLDLDTEPEDMDAFENPKYVFDPTKDLDEALEDFHTGFPSGSSKVHGPFGTSTWTQTASSGKKTTTTGGTTKNKPYKPSKTTTTYTSKCRHYSPESAVTICEGVQIYPSSMNNNRKEEDLAKFTPDFGLYADTGWKPEWRNEFIVFPDYGIPTFDIAVEQITSACVRAADLDQKVEIGCIGGHGRTGTILACMFIWGSYRDGKPITPEEAIKKVRDPKTGICNHAIETEQQEWWVSLYSHYEFGSPEKLPEKPVKAVKTYSSGTSGMSGGCTETSHVEMMEAGATQCLAKGSKCSFWTQDTKQGKEGAVYKRNIGKAKKNAIDNWKKVLEDKAKKESGDPKVTTPKQPSKNSTPPLSTGSLISTKTYPAKKQKSKVKSKKNKSKKKFGKRSR